MAGPSLKLIVRRPGTIEVLAGPPGAQETAASFEASSYATSPDGSHLVLVEASQVQVVDGASFKQVCALPVEGVSSVEVSSGGRFVMTLQKTTKESNEKNLKLWELRSGSLVLEVHHKPKGSGVPKLQLTSDDSLAFHMVTNTLHAYRTNTPGAGPALRLQVKGIANFAISPATEMVACYVPEAKGSPGYVALYEYGALGSEVAAPTPVARKAFYRSSAVDLMWNARGSAVLALAMSDVDATNQSYYGEQKLHYLAVTGDEQTVALPKDGPIHDVKWSPSGEHFVAVAGFMPAKITLYTDKCKPIFDFGSGPYNIVRWNAFGKFLAIAGFGNLPGDITFWIRLADGKLKQMGSTRASNGVTCDWAPDGRTFLVATIAPRLRVDNGWTTYKYDGSMLDAAQYDIMLDASYMPAVPGTFEDRPQSPRAAGAAQGGAGAAGAASGGGPARPSGYVPPHLRNNPAAAARAAASFSLAHDPKDKIGKIAEKYAKRLPPGAELANSKSAVRNAKKRAAKKKASGGAEDGGSVGDAAAADGATVGMASMSVGGGAQPAAAAAAGDSPAAAAAGGGGPGAGGGSGAGGAAPGAGSADSQKRARNLQKKLNQIQQLKERRDREGAASMDPDQINKIGTEAEVLKELRELGAAP